MKYAVDMGSGAMIYIPSFIKIGSGIQKLIVGHTVTHGQHGDRKSLHLFSQNKETKLTNCLFNEVCISVYSAIDMYVLCDWMPASSYGDPSSVTIAAGFVADEAVALVKTFVRLVRFSLTIHHSINVQYYFSPRLR
jgi:hypothetical protein